VFGYDGELGRKVLNDVSIEIPRNKITAIVGPSGSGKTTFLKLLLRLHEPTSGELLVGDTRIAAFEHKFWRSKCAAVMQDGFIFSDTIAKNISMSEEDNIDYEQLRYAIDVANIKEFVEALPLGINTRIGAEGVGLSQGQRQRVLIARAVYRNPDYLFLDEATNALDSRNEKSIMENLDKFFRSRTVVIVAHRLSTVLHSDKILVLENGKISEEGDHIQLVGRRGLYYSLVQNQIFNQ
jgi:ATP-binding cassette subfamily B protein